MVGGGLRATTRGRSAWRALVPDPAPNFREPREDNVLRRLSSGTSAEAQRDHARAASREPGEGRRLEEYVGRRSSLNPACGAWGLVGSREGDGGAPFSVVLT